MTAHWKTLRTLYRTELRIVLRDRRILFTSILLPVLMMPLMFIGSSWTLKKRQTHLREASYRYAIAGENADLVREWVRTGVKSFAAGKNGATNAFVESHPADAETELRDGKLEVILEADTDAAVSSAVVNTNHVASSAKSDDGRKKHSSKRKAADDEDAEDLVSGAPRIRVVFRGDRDLSSSAAAQFGEVLRRARQVDRAGLLAREGFPVKPNQVATIVEKDLASKLQVAGSGLGRFVTLFLVFFILTGGSVVAMDALAGEKERGTLETLLTTSVRRSDVIWAKLLVVITIALIITSIQVASMLLYARLNLLPGSLNLTASLTFPVAVLLFFLFLPVATLAGSALLITSGYARTYKEAQMYFFPVIVLGVIPTLAPLFPGLSLRSIVVLVPVANIALSVKDILVGSFDWPFIVLSWVITAAASVGLVSIATRFLSAEQLVTGSGKDAVDVAGGTDLFSRHVLRWFAILWALLLIVNNYLEKADIRVQLFVNLVVLFFGASCLMIAVYRLNVREALALRLPRPIVWPAVIVAVPCGLIAASGLFRLANYFIPISSKMMQQFDQAVVPPGVTFAQLLFFLAVMPGFFEEIAFRGLLLHGLSRRLHPILTAVLVGVIFGLFHIALFRFAPTAVLGIMLAAVTLLTGSIFPAMLWHCLSNATSLLAYKFGYPLTELDAPSYLLSSAILAMCFWVIWRNRTPYPGLGSRRFTLSKSV